MAKSTIWYIHRKIKCTAGRSNTKRPETPQSITKVDYNFICLRQVKNAFIVFIKEVFTSRNLIERVYSKVQTPGYMQKQ